MICFCHPFFFSISCFDVQHLGQLKVFIFWQFFASKTKKFDDNQKHFILKGKKCGYFVWQINGSPPSRQLQFIRCVFFTTKLIRSCQFFCDHSMVSFVLSMQSYTLWYKRFISSTENIHYRISKIWSKRR